MFEIIVRQGQYSFVFCSRGYEAFNSDGMIRSVILSTGL